MYLTEIHGLNFSVAVSTNTVLSEAYLYVGSPVQYRRFASYVTALLKVSVLSSASMNKAVLKTACNES